MQDTIIRYLNGIPEVRERYNLQFILFAIGDRLSSQLLTNGGLAIKAGASALAKAVNAIQYVANGITQTKGANTDMAALAGTVANATFNVYVFYGDQAGTLTTAMGTAAATLAAVKYPQTPQGKAIIGFVVINPTGTGPFIGGTTALDDATVVPNAVYVNTVGAFDPTVILQ